MITHLMTRGRLLFLAGAIVLVALLALFAPTGASEYLIQEEPERGSTVSEAPHALLLTFDRPLAQLKNAHHVEVTDAAGHRVDKGHAEISNYSLRTLVVELSEAGDGELEVSYSVMLEGDGELLNVSSFYRFRVDHTLPPFEGESVGAATEAKSTNALVLWTIVILIGIAVAGGLLYFLRMATGNSRSSLEPTNRTVFRD